MFDPERRPSDSESLSSSDTTDITSRATTPQTSWSITTQQKRMNRLNQFNIQPIEQEPSPIPSIANESDVTDSRKSPDSQKNNNKVNTQKPWVNPYWGPNWNSGTTVTQPKPNNNTNSEHSSSSTRPPQLIPGSILINDGDEMDGLVGKPNTQLKSSISDASSNLDSSYQFNRQQTFPATTDNNIQPWNNPYLPNPNQNISEYLEKKNTSQNETAPSSNNSKQSSPINSSSGTKFSEKSTPSAETWKNPYWKDWKPQDSSTSNKQQDKSWKNPYWEDNNISKQDDNDAAFNKSLSSEPKVLPIPSFYHRIYPPSAPLSSPVSTNNKTVFSSGIPEKNKNDDEDSIYTIDSQRIAHYKPESSSPNLRNTTSNYASSPPNSPYHVLPSQKHSSAPIAQTTSSAFLNNIVPAPSTNVNNHPSSSFNYYTSPTSSRGTVLTEEELNSIHDVLHLLKTNPNAIPTIEASDPVLSSNISQHNNPSSPLASLFTVNREQQQPASFSRNAQSNSQQVPLFSTPSYPSHHSNQQRPIVLI